MMDHSTPNPPVQIEARRAKPNFWAPALAPAIVLIASYEFILPTAVSWATHLPSILGGWLVFVASGVVVPFAAALLVNLGAFTGFFFFLGVLGYLYPGDAPTTGGVTLATALATLPLDVLAALLVAGAGWLGSRISLSR